MMASADHIVQGSSGKTSAISNTLQTRPDHTTNVVVTGKEYQPQKQHDHSWSRDEESDGDKTPVADEPPHSVPQLQRWNSPRINTFRTLATFWDFMILGAGDGVYGWSLPDFEQMTSLSTCPLCISPARLTRNRRLDSLP